MKAQDLLNLGDPWQVFKSWYEEAGHIATLKEPTAVTLATADSQGRPSARTVLLKRFSESQGFVFFTNYDSQKGRELKENPAAALLFYWDATFKQVRIEGTATRLPREESLNYWNSRPWESQLAGFVSQQSAPIVGSLEEQMTHARAKWQGKAIPCPENWGGFALVPSAFEFWIGHKFRMHDRVRFSRHGLSWSGQQLYP